MQKIIPHIWFDKQAEEAAKFYTSIFKDGKILDKTHYTEVGCEIHGMEAGTVMTVDFEIEGVRFVALNGGPAFTVNPSISFIVNRSSKEEIDGLWERLSEGGSVLMPLNSYPFSERYGWVQDRFGVSWQLILPSTEGDWRPSLVPSLLFVKEMNGKAEEAMSFYRSVFKESEGGTIARYGVNQAPNKEGTVMYGDFKIFDQWIAVMDSALPHDFSFNEAISFMIVCKDQAEIDYYWEKLSAVPEAEQCGWLKDKYGVSWQVVPAGMNEALNDPDTEKAKRSMAAMLQMKKIDIEKLKNA